MFNQYNNYNLSYVAIGPRSIIFFQETKFVVIIILKKNCVINMNLLVFIG